MYRRKVAVFIHIHYSLQDEILSTVLTTRIEHTPARGEVEIGNPREVMTQVGCWTLVGHCMKIKINMNN